MKKETLYRCFTIVAPVAAVFCAIGASGFEWRRLKHLESETTAAEVKLAQIDQELRSFEAQPPSEKYPTVPKSPREQGLFLDSLRANADACKVELVRWSNTTPPSAAPTDKGALPQGVSAVISTIEVVGRSENTRWFLYNVLRSRRLLNMSDLKWVREQWPNTHLTFTLTRYIAPEVALPGARAGVPSQPPADAHTAASTLPTGTPAGSAAPDAATAVLDRERKAAAGGGLALPNPMDAPGIAHGSYQSRLETNVSKLNGMEPGQAQPPHHSPPAADTQH